MKYLITTISFTFSLVFTSQALAANVTKITKIDQIYTYGTYETNNTRYRNDIVIKVVAPAPGCEAGFYISADDNENNPTMAAFLLSAFHTNNNVRFGAYTNQLWDGSSSTKFCRIINLALIK